MAFSSFIGADKEPWRLCQDWLIKIGLYTKDDSFFCSNAEEFVQLLQDGVLLCKTLHLIDPTAIDMEKTLICDGQLSKLVWEQNITLFKQVCKTSFGIQEGQLNGFNELNIRKVISSLSVLSHTTKASKKVGPFDFDDNQDGTRDYDEASFSHTGFYTYEVPVPEKIEESEMSSASGGSSTLSESSQSAFASMVNEEIDFTSSLVRVRDNESQLQRLFGRKKCDEIFYRFKELTRLHLKFSTEMRSAYPNDLMSLGNAFLKHWSSFLMYQDYCSNYQRNRRYFREQMKQIEVTPGETVGIHESELSSLLSRPRHRICDYSKQLYQLSDLLRQESQYEEVRKIEKAELMMQKMCDLTKTAVSDQKIIDMFNEKTTQFRNAQKLPACIKTFKGCGRLIHYDNVLFRIRRSVKKNFEGLLYIFEEIILIFRVRNKKREQYTEFYKSMQVSDIDPKMYTEVEKELTPELKKNITVFTLEKNTNHNSLIFTPMDRNKGEELRRVILSVCFTNSVKLPRRNHAFVVTSLMTKTNEVDIFCDLCFNYLSGIYEQCYICSNDKCRMKAHSHCILIANEFDCGSDQTVMSRLRWWVGEMPRTYAIEYLTGIYQPGLYFIRWSKSALSLVISLCTSEVTGKIEHLLIDSEEGYSLKCSSPKITFPYLRELKNYYKETNIGGTIQKISCRLLCSPKSYRDIDLKN